MTEPRPNRPPEEPAQREPGSEPTVAAPAPSAWRFDRQEFAGSLGDLGTLLPISMGLIVINGLSATAVLITVGLFYVLTGLYFRTTVPVQPMKVIGAYAIARVMTPQQISLSGLWVGIFLLVLAATGATKLLDRYVPKPVVRGVQLSTGILLSVEGIRLMLGHSALQAAHRAAEPFLSVSHLGPVPIGPVLGGIALLLILALLNNRRTPAALVVVAAGSIAGLALGACRELSAFRLGLHLPAALPYGWPTAHDGVVALTVLALPQIPMTVGNAVIAQADLTREYFGEEVAKRSSVRALSVSMGLANVIVPLLGGMPVCHGAGGLAAHYRFGARTVGSNLMIGSIILGLGLLFGPYAASLLSVLPLSVLGALLVFAGAQLALLILDVRERRDLFVVIAMLAVALASNLAVGFVVGIVLAYALRHPRLTI